MPLVDYFRNKAKKCLLVFQKSKRKKELKDSLKEIQVIKEEIKRRKKL